MPNHGCADESEEIRRSYSLPCYLREVDPAYLGYLTKPEILELLNELLEGERAGVRAATHCLTEAVDRETHATLRRIAIDEARFCAMLSRHIRDLGGMPSPATGTFYGKLMAIAELPKRLAFLNRGQGWVVRRLCDALPRVRDDRLYEDLKAMLQAHEVNIGRCDRLLNARPSRPDSAPPP
jgi:hypothetical protein